jgi:hypothetical protein
LIPNFEGRKKQNPPQNPKPKNTQLFLPAAWACYLWVLSCMRLELISKNKDWKWEENRRWKKKKKMNSFFSHIPKRSKWRVPSASLLTQRHTHTHHNEWEREREREREECQRDSDTPQNYWEVWYWTQWTNWLDSLGWQKLALLTYS